MWTKHPNRVPFEGVLTVVNAASDKAPAGARGHRVMLTREAAEKALPSLLGMAVDYRPGWDGHDARRKIGLLTEADVIGPRLVVRGYLYARDFPEVARAIEAHAPETTGHELRAGRCARRGYAGRDLEVDPGDLYRCGNSAAGQGGLPGDELPDGELVRGRGVSSVSGAGGVRKSAESEELSGVWKLGS